MQDTHLEDSLYAYIDESYDHTLYPRVKYTSHVNQETATAPDEKKSGFTAFVPTDSILRLKYGITTMEQLYQRLVRFTTPHILRMSINLTTASTH